MITLLVRQIIEPEKAIILGGTWRIPVLVGLLDRNFVQDLKRDGTFNDAAFAREYEEFVFVKLLRIAETALEILKLQYKDEISLGMKAKNLRYWQIRSRVLMRERFND